MSTSVGNIIIPANGVLLLIMKPPEVKQVTIKQDMQAAALLNIFPLLNNITGGWDIFVL